MTRVLVVEDDAFIAMDLELALMSSGYDVAGPAKSVADGLAVLASETVDGALVDLNLGEERSDALADRLASDCIPFLFLTGYSSEALPPAHRDRPIHSKPFKEKELLALLARICR